MKRLITVILLLTVLLLAGADRQERDNTPVLVRAPRKAYHEELKWLEQRYVEAVERTRTRYRRQLEQAMQTAMLGGDAEQAQAIAAMVAQLKDVPAKPESIQGFDVSRYRWVRRNLKGYVNPATLHKNGRVDWEKRTGVSRSWKYADGSIQIGNAAPLSIVWTPVFLFDDKAGNFLYPHPESLTQLAKQTPSGKR